MSRNPDEGEEKPGTADSLVRKNGLPPKIIMSILLPDIELVLFGTIRGRRLYRMGQEVRDLLEQQFSNFLFSGPFYAIKSY